MTIEEKLQQLTGQMEEFFSSMQKAGVQIEQIRTELTKAGFQLVSERV